MIKVHEVSLGSFIFDGQALYSASRIVIPNVYSQNTHTNRKTQISLKLVAEIAPTDPVFLQVYNIIFRNIMTTLGLQLMGRFYYEPSAKIEFKARRLEVWPGYITSVRNQEHEILLNVELTHKVVRSESVLEFINDIKKTARPGDYQREVCKHLLRSIVLTGYNNKTYKVDDIEWKITPRCEFQMKDGSKVSYKDYYQTHYGITIKNMDQPMLVSLPKKKDYHRGSAQPIFLVPEVCHMTGLSDSMRKDVALMKELSGDLVLSPSERVRNATGFIRRWYATPSIVKELEKWNLEISMDPVKCKGRTLEMESIIVGNAKVAGGSTKVEQDRHGDWSNIFKGSH